MQEALGHHGHGHSHLPGAVRKHPGKHDERFHGVQASSYALVVPDGHTTHAQWKRDDLDRFYHTLFHCSILQIIEEFRNLRRDSAQC